MTNQELENEVMSLKARVNSYGEAIKVCMEGLKEIISLLSEVESIVREDDKDNVESVDNQRFGNVVVLDKGVTLSQIYREKR